MIDIVFYRNREDEAESRNGTFPIQVRTAAELKTAMLVVDRVWAIGARPAPVVQFRKTQSKERLSWDQAIEFLTG